VGHTKKVERVHLRKTQHKMGEVFPETEPFTSLEKERGKGGRWWQEESEVEKKKRQKSRQ